jgi:diaminohydroxyphosphoribosylaminopyrimidine deaminase / 5-amino-6-(5-phosphoribosylamino)uracil reductase
VDDTELMARAVALGERGRLGAPPNPWVGCVVARDGVVVGEGFHHRAGESHAEVLALRDAGPRAEGATAYITLEPCAHLGRTPPCTDALIAADVRRVVVAVEDPDPHVQGRGIGALQASGIEVAVGVGATDARRSLAPYLHHRGTGRAFCLVKTAMSLDGRAAAADGSSRWITGEEARADAHRLRAESQAVVVGSGTARADRPMLTVRAGRVERQPLRVVLDGRGCVPATGPLFDVELAPTLVLTTDRAPTEAVDAWRATGAKVEAVRTDDGGRVDLGAVLELLAREGVVQALFEGGPTVHGAVMAAGLMNRLVAYVAPTVLGADARAAFEWAGPATVDAASRFDLIGTTQLGTDVRLEFEARAAASGEGA